MAQDIILRFSYLYKYLNYELAHKRSLRFLPINLKYLAHQATML